MTTMLSKKVIHILVANPLDHSDTPTILEINLLQ